jgi:conjugal transfer pilus assembly protein TraV
MKKMIQLTTILLSALSTTACVSTHTDQYGCKGMEEGVRCIDTMSALEVTKIENWKERTKGGLDKDGNLIVPTTENPDKRFNLVVQAPRIGEVSNPVKTPLPILRQAEVLMIWIAPWVDEMKDLHMESIIFTEITPRKWSFGEESVQEYQSFTPYQVDDETKNKEQKQ